MISKYKCAASWQVKKWVTKFEERLASTPHARSYHSADNSAIQDSHQQRTAVQGPEHSQLKHTQGALIRNLEWKNTREDIFRIKWNVHGESQKCKLREVFRRLSSFLFKYLWKPAFGVILALKCSHDLCLPLVSFLPISYLLIVIQAQTWVIFNSTCIFLESSCCQPVDSSEFSVQSGTSVIFNISYNTGSVASNRTSKMIMFIQGRYFFLVSVNIGSPGLVKCPWSLASRSSFSLSLKHFLNTHLPCMGQCHIMIQDGCSSASHRVCIPAREEEGKMLKISLKDTS